MSASLSSLRPSSPPRWLAALSVQITSGPMCRCPNASRARPAQTAGRRHRAPTSALWWEGFADPRQRFVTLALEQNLDLAQASARVAQARAGLGAANAALLPSGSVSESGGQSLSVR